MTLNSDRLRYSRKRRGIKMLHNNGGDEPDFSELCFVGGDLTEFSLRRFGPEIRRIDLSFNSIQKLKGVEGCADHLEEIILDNNQLQYLDIAGVTFPKLHTISLNKNKISNLKLLLDTLKRYAPKLRYLSILGNPVCPDQLSDDYVDESDYQIYRYHVLFHLKNLRFLDHRQVSQLELSEAQKPLYGNVRIHPTVTPLPHIPTGRHRSVSTSSSTSTASRVTSATNRGRQGKRRFKYLGKNSEGNRFIKDGDL